MSDLTTEELDSLLGENLTEGEMAEDPSGTSDASEGKSDIDLLDSLIDDGSTKAPPKEVSRAKLAELKGKEDGGGNITNMQLLMDVPMRISVELGRASRTVKDILALNVGSVVELDKLSGEPVDLLVNGRIVAKAEVVVIDENFGVRITEIIKVQDRIVIE